jgi:hypothetical protein
MLVIVVETQGMKPNFLSINLKKGSASHVARIVVGSGPNQEAKDQPPGSCFVIVCERPNNNPKGLQHVFRANDSLEAARWVSSIQRARSSSNVSFSKLPQEDIVIDNPSSSSVGEVVTTSTSPLKLIPSSDNVIRQNSTEMFTI